MAETTSTERRVLNKTRRYSLGRRIEDQTIPYFMFSPLTKIDLKTIQNYPRFSGTPVRIRMEESHTTQRKWVPYLVSSLFLGLSVGVSFVSVALHRINQKDRIEQKSTNAPIAIYRWEGFHRVSPAAVTAA